MTLNVYTCAIESSKKSSLAINVLQDLKSALDVKEMLVSSYSKTINIFLVCDESAPSIEKITQNLQKITGLRVQKKSEIKSLSNHDAVHYFLKHANGINGENQFRVIQLFADDLNKAKKAATIGPVFQRLFQRSIWLHEKIRMTTNYFNYSTDNAKIFCELAEKIYESISKITVQVLGVEEKAIKFIHNLYQFGCRKFIFDGTEADFDKLTDNVQMADLISRGSNKLSPHADVLISCSNNDTSLFTDELLAKRMAEKNNAPFLILSILDNPQIQSIINKSFNIYHYNMADLEHIVAKNTDYRTKILKEILPWLNQEVEDFFKWFAGKDRFHFANIIGQSAKMQEMFELISRISQTDISVLIQGASGTGKELVSKAIHNLSARNDKAFIVVNCGAIPENLIESELFGHMRGSFTGAVSNKKGLFYEAHNGTILLDEIGELPQLLQVKLLRFLQEGDIKPVGSNETIKVNVRVLAATNRNLQEMVDQGKFRSDLFYRLNVILLDLPALAERKEDIALLAHFFLNKYAQKFSKEVKDIAQEAMENLLEYNWPGNVRELENAIEHSVALSLGKQLLLYDLPDSISNINKKKSTFSVQDNQNGVTRLKDVEKIHITKILKNTSWDYEKACSILGIGRTTLWRKIKEYDIKQ